MADNKSSFVIDVANDRTYQNQNDEYNKAYAAWRSDPANPYAYSFVHDTREHSYVAGEGFLKRRPDVAEHIALYKCLGLLGVIMLIMLAFDVVNYAVMQIFFSECTGNFVYFSQKTMPAADVPFSAACIFSIIVILKYLTAMLVFKAATKIPNKVALVYTKVSSQISLNAVAIMLMIVVIGRCANYVMSRISALVNVDNIYVFMFQSSDYRVRILSAVLNCIALPVLCEMFFRGFVLQTFRQFGDSFAIIISCFVCGLTFYDVPYICYAISCSALLGIFTIRTGSVYVPIFMHIVSTSCNYVLSAIALTNTSTGRLLEMVCCLTITAAAIAAFSKLNEKKNWSFNIMSDHSLMPFSKKIKVMLLTNTIAFWIVGCVIMTIFMARIL